jgi:hypothetical protein
MVLVQRFGARTVNHSVIVNPITIKGSSINSFKGKKMGSINHCKTSVMYSLRKTMDSKKKQVCKNPKNVTHIKDAKLL